MGAYLGRDCSTPSGYIPAQSRRAGPGSSGALAAFDCPDGTLTEAGAKNACANEVSPVAAGPEDVFWRTRDGPAGRLYGVCEEYWPVI